MHLTNCPVCHSAIDLLSIVEDEGGRELLTEVTKLESWLAPMVLLYIGLFKPAKSKLNNARAAKLLKETLALTSNHRLLANACEKTVVTIRENRKTHQAKMFKDHTYLKAVIESMSETEQAITDEQPKSRAVIKKQGVELSNEEAQAQFDEMMAKYKTTPTKKAR
ncbi:hypothetical protein tloyanaT_25780 [Thalassotalea loyana]|uniref:Uncharacterized protein n=1 Tax=Thalassotalea loyana TaxID=280483 RepID=A0ABQ6HDY5_9GAMM|nr:hypothetical protein [Thalassotalea loyana]GLX86325.1 hypothetical protein tloyanaT_25780 [Thalassotalea loyana]